MRVDALLLHGGRGDGGRFATLGSCGGAWQPTRLSASVAAWSVGAPIP